MTKKFMCVQCNKKKKKKKYLVVCKSCANKFCKKCAQQSFCPHPEHRTCFHCNKINRINALTRSTKTLVASINQLKNLIAK